MPAFFVVEVKSIRYYLDMQKEAKSNLGEVKKGESDIDIQQLADNLKRSPAERIKRHQSALNLAMKLRKAKHV